MRVRPGSRLAPDTPGCGHTDSAGTSLPHGLAPDREAAPERDPHTPHTSGTICANAALRSESQAGTRTGTPPRTAAQAPPFAWRSQDQPPPEECPRTADCEHT